MSTHQMITRSMRTRSVTPTPSDAVKVAFIPLLNSTPAPPTFVKLRRCTHDVNTKFAEYIDMLVCPWQLKLPNIAIQRCTTFLDTLQAIHNGVVNPSCQNSRELTHILHGCLSDPIIHGIWSVKHLVGISPALTTQTETQWKIGDEGLNAWYNHTQKMASVWFERIMHRFRTNCVCIQNHHNTPYLFEKCLDTLAILQSAANILLQHVTCLKLKQTLVDGELRHDLAGIISKMDRSRHQRLVFGALYEKVLAELRTMAALSRVMLFCQVYDYKITKDTYNMTKVAKLIT